MFRCEGPSPLCRKVCIALCVLVYFFYELKTKKKEGFSVRRMVLREGVYVNIDGKYDFDVVTTNNIHDETVSF